MQRFLIVLLACFAASQATARDAALLVYKVWEDGIDPYISRILVTPDHLRLDEGAGSDGYTLFDRDQEIIYNVSVEDQSVLVLDQTDAVVQSSEALILDEKVTTDPRAPMVAGQRPRQIELLANGEVCGEITVIDGVMQDAVEALREMKLALARIHAARLAVTPLEMRTPCDLAGNVYAADRYLRFGLPLQERSPGRSQSLVDFAESFAVDDSLFEIPQGFGRRPMFLSGAI